jgi:uncharacterized protein with von Willebrand factor type A (vWA) domain
MTNNTKALQRAIDRVKDWSGKTAQSENVHLFEKADPSTAQQSSNQN